MILVTPLRAGFSGRDNNQLHESLSLLLKGHFPMIKLPNNFSHKKVEPIFSHATNTTHLPFENAPEAFYIVSVDVAANVLAAVMVDVLVTKRTFRNASIHLEAVRVESALFAHLTLDDGKQNLYPELPWLQLHIHLAGLTRKQAHDWQLIRPVASFGLYSPDMKLLVLSLPSNVRLIHFYDARKRCRDVTSHNGAQVMDGTLCGLEAHPSFLGDASLGALP